MKSSLERAREFRPEPYQKTECDHYKLWEYDDVDLGPTTIFRCSGCGMTAHDNEPALYDRIAELHTLLDVHGIQPPEDLP